MITYYDIGTLLIVSDSYTHEDIICVVVGIGTVNVYESREDVLYHGFSLNHNSPYFFFDSDVVCRMEDR